jgi:hypothetical protein
MVTSHGFDPSVYRSGLSGQNRRDFDALGRNTGGDYSGWAKNAGFGNDPANAFNRRYGMPQTNMPGVNFQDSGHGNDRLPHQMGRQPRRTGGAGGMVDPSFRSMMAMKAGQPTADRLASQGFKVQTPSPGMFPGLDPSIFYQHFDPSGRVRQPQQQMDPMMGGIGMINTGPSDQMMRQFNPGMMGGFGGGGGGIWNPVYDGGPDTSGMMGQMRNRGMGGGMFGRMGY